MDGKKKKRDGLLIAKPDYKKAYVNPLSISLDLYPVEEEYEQEIKSSIVEDDEAKKMHWLDGKKYGRSKSETSTSRGYDGDRSNVGAAPAKFPWSSMRTYAGQYLHFLVLFS